MPRPHRPDVNPLVSDYLTAAQAAAVVRVAPYRIRFACHMGFLKAQKLGKSWAIKPKDLAAWANATHARRMQQKRKETL